MIQVYKDVIFYWVFQNGTIKKIQPIWVHYAKKLLTHPKTPVWWLYNWIEFLKKNPKVKR